MFKNTHLWLADYLRGSSKRLKLNQINTPIHVMFCLVDHYEPDRGQASMEVQRRRVKRWVDQYPLIAKRHRDADGKSPKHSFFYPAEVYDLQHLNQLKTICGQGLGEVEVHLHHRHDTPDGFRTKLKKAKSDFVKHGFLGKDRASGQIRFAFIHGNWALNNSRGDGDWCGVDNETKILNEEGCYADFTLPSAPSDTQTSKINSIYYATAQDKPKAHNTGVDVKVGGQSGDLMMIQGPLALNFQSRKWGIVPRIENGDVASYQPVDAPRVELWARQNIYIKGRPEWIFIKVHTHGAPEKNADYLLGNGLENLYSLLEKRFNDQKTFFLHYVSAREMYNIIKAAETGKSGNPGQFRDFAITSL